MTNDNDLELNLSASLNAILPAYPEYLPEKTPLPALVYTRMGGAPNNTVCDDDYTADFRFTVFAETVAERAKLVQQIREKLQIMGFEQGDAPVYTFDFYSKAHTAVLIYLVD